MKCQSLFLFSVKNKKTIINFSSAEYVLRVVKVARFVDVLKPFIQTKRLVKVINLFIQTILF